MTDTPDTPSQPAAKKAAAPSGGRRSGSGSAAKKTAAAPAKSSDRAPYLPALPDGYAYTRIEATGKNGETFVVTPATDPKAPVGSSTLTFEGAGAQGEKTYESFNDALTEVAKKAKAMNKIAEREAEAKRLREEALGL